MEDRSTWKVGLVALLALIGLFGMLAFLVPALHAKVTGGRWSFYIIFDDVGGLQPAEKVTLAGVSVGDVDRVDLVTDPNSRDAIMVERFLTERGAPQRPLPFGLVKVNIEPRYKGELYSFYSYQVGSSSLIGTTHQVTITPGPPPSDGAQPADVIRPNDVVVGTASMGLTDLARPAGNMMGAVTNLTNKITDLVADPKLKSDLLASLEQVHGAAANMNAVTSQARDLAANANITLSRALPRIGQSMQNVEATTANFRAASARVPLLMNQVQGSLGQVRGNLVAASSNVTATTARLRSFVAESGTLDELHGTAQELHGTAANFNQITGDLKNLTSRPEFQQDLPAIVTNLKDATARLGPTLDQAKSTMATFQQTGQSVNETLASVRSILPGRKTTGAGTSPPPPARQTVSLYSGIGLGISTKTSSRFTHRGLVDPEVTFNFGSNSYSLGIFDLGGQSRLNAQIGKRLVGTPNNGLGFRYGMYRGLAGAGFDYVLNPKLGFYATAYDPNVPSVDLETILGLNDHYALWAGLDELNRRPRPVLGLRVLTK